MPHMSEWGPPAKAPNTKGVWKWQEIAIAPTPDQGTTCYAAENSKPRHAWERNSLLDFAVGLTGLASYFTFLCEEELFTLHWDPLSCCKLDLLECIMPEMEHPP